MRGRGLPVHWLTGSSPWLTSAGQSKDRRLGGVVYSWAVGSYQTASENTNDKCYQSIDSLTLYQST